MARLIIGFILLMLVGFFLLSILKSIVFGFVFKLVKFAIWGAIGIAAVFLLLKLLKSNG
jgi:uncharacterized membrane protein YuzA (DUF378 family)